jgi:hypothetical protein
MGIQAKWSGLKCEILFIHFPGIGNRDFGLSWANVGVPALPNSDPGIRPKKRVRQGDFEGSLLVGMRIRSTPL